ncbi:hypothetical protein ACFW1A_10700 [Kitasatospora sp. NPDC058965]|uniref:hypothetical protein n=1 Tax=Kitasatospora sp. NPDC058965 TaxID=3346682 RepID=UPI00369F7BB0
MTKPSTAPGTAAIPRQRAGRAAPAATGYPPAEPQPTGWAAVRRTLAILRGLVSMRSVPARPQRHHDE